MKRLFVTCLASTLLAATFTISGPTHHAAAAGGCVAADAVVAGAAVGFPPPTARAGLAATFGCSYVSSGGQVTWNCVVTAGFCNVTPANVGCSGVLARCGGSFFVASGTVVTVTVALGHGAAADTSSSSCPPTCAGDLTSSLAGLPSS